MQYNCQPLAVKKKQEPTSLKQDLWLRRLKFSFFFIHSFVYSVLNILQLLLFEYQMDTTRLFLLLFLNAKFGLKLSA